MPVFRPWLPIRSKKTVRRTAARPQLVCLEDRTTPSTVDILTDVVDPADGKTSLREAVAMFNADPDDFLSNSISFDNTFNGKTILLTAGELVVTAKTGATNTTLSVMGQFSKDGPVVISGNGAGRVFSVSDGTTLSISEIALTAGKADKGGAIFNAGVLSLNGAKVFGNEATDSGGGVFNAATGKVTVGRSVFSNNTATTGNGGAILDFGGVGFAVIGSAFSGNTAGGLGGAILAGNLNLSNSTISGNTAAGDGAGLWVNGQLLSVNNTIVLNTSTAGQGAGLFVDAAGPGVAILANTLIAGNTGGDIVGDATGGGASKFNFIGDPAFAGNLTNGGASGNILGDGAGALLAVDKVVNVTLAANSGTGPFTHALAAGSPAFDKGDKTLAITPGTAFAITEDGRGFFARVAGADVDIGAFEVQNLAPVVASTTAKVAILEDDATGVVFTGAGKTVVVTDPDAVNPTYAVTIVGSLGTVTIVTTAGLTDLTGNGTDKVTFKATTLAAVNAALDGTKFVGAANKNGSGGFSVTVSDGDVTALGGAKDGAGQADVTITGVIDAPSITSPSTAKNTPVVVTLTRNAVDGNEITHFKVTNLVGGTLTYLPAPTAVNNTPVTVTVGDAMFFGGTFFNLTPDAETKFTFTPTAGFEGTASFNVQLAQGVYAMDVPGQPANPAPVFGGTVISSTITVGTPPADTTVPTAKLDAAAGVTTAGAATYDFTVVYADNVGVDAATFDGKDVRVTGPGGFNALASFVKSDITGNGTPRTVTYRIVPPGGTWDNADNGTYTISVEAAQVLDTVANAVAAGALGSFTVNVSPAVAAPKPALVGVPLYAVGSDKGGGEVRFFNADKSARLVDPLKPFGDFTGGVRTASADFNGDGVADIVAGTGPGRATRVVVIDGATFKELFATDPFEASFTGGVYVAAGDVDGDGVADLIITPDEGGGPRVDIYAGKGFGKAASFFGIDDTNFRGGARASTGDLNGDGRADLIVVAGFGGGPRVAAFNGKSLGGTPSRVFGDFFAFEQTLRNGIFVTAGDLNGDGFADLICGGGPGGGPRVLAFSGKDLTAAGAQTQTQLANFFGGDSNSRGGIRLSVKDLDGDTRADLVVGAGAGAGSRVTSYLGKTIPTDGPPAENYSFDAVAGFTGGVFVG